MAYMAQLLPDEEGCRALRKLMKAAVDEDVDMPALTVGELDAIHELYSKLSADMRRRR